MSSATPGIHRTSEVSRLAEALEQPAEGLSIVSVSGPGGVGKSYLLGHVLEKVQPESLGYLVLRADASNPDTRNDLLGLLEGQLFRRSLEAPALPGRDYFPRLRELAEEHRNVTDQALNELAKRGAPPHVQKAARILLRTGRILNGSASSSLRVFDAAKIDDLLVTDALDVAWDLVRDLKGLRDATKWPGPLRDLFGITRRNRLKRDFFALTAAELRADLSAALVGYEARDAKKVTHERIAGRDKLLLVLDDYEAIGHLLNDFLIAALVPALSTAPFRTVIVVLGRDDLQATHTGWDQHARRFLREQIRLAPFDRETSNQLFDEAGIEETRWSDLYEATQGFPFFIRLVAEEASSGGDSALILRRFYERVTRWMTAREREWFDRICYLERVDEDTLRGMFPDEADIGKIQDWFEAEQSIRDASAAYFRVRPLVRDKILRYLAVRKPSRHHELEAQAAKATRAQGAQDATVAPPTYGSGEA